MRGCFSSWDARDEAKKVLQKAVALDGQKSPELMVHYGDILHELGEQFMAEIYWKRALEKATTPDRSNCG